MKAIAERLRRLSKEAADIADVIERQGITEGNGLQIIACEQCGAQVKQRTVWQKYCGEDCRAKAHGFASIEDAKQAANRKRRKA